MNDTSHYAECLTLMNQYKRLHLKRLVILAILIIMNFYVHVLTFGVKYAGESFHSAIMANGEREIPITPLGLVNGIVIFALIAAIVGIGLFLFKGFRFNDENDCSHKIFSNKLKTGYIIIVVTFLGGFAFIQQIRAKSTVDGKIGVSHLAFGMGILTLLLSIACLLLALFGDHQHPKLYFTLIALLVIGGVIDCYQWIIALLMVLLYLTALPEYRKMRWILKQPGYPYFNERFQEQLLHSEYEPIHKLDNKNHGVMAGLENGEDAVTSAVAPKHPYPTAAYTLTANSPDEMPGISDICELPSTEPKPPNTEEIPDPVWNVPDATISDSNPKSDVLTDVSTLSSFPELPDIPDLPELPDIPQL